ncbi:MAG: MATE family efflux transporter [bacterium]
MSVNNPPDLLKGDPVKTLIALSVPAIILNILKAGYNIVDMFWLGKLGKEYLAGVSASIFLVWGMHGLASFTTVGIVAGISRNIGEGKIELARSNTWLSLKYSLILGLILTFFLYPLINPLVEMIHLDNIAHKAGIEYLQIIISFMVVSFLMFALHSIMIAWGDTKTPVKVYAATFILNIFLSPLLMLGIGPFPRLETKGAAIATVISYFIGSAVFFTVILKNRWVSFNKVGFEMPFKKYIMIGYPVALSSMFFSFIYFFIAKITALFGSNAVGAMGIGHKIESLAYFFSHGIAAGLSTFTGRNLGAGMEERVKIGTMASLKFVTVISMLYSLFTFIFAPQLVSIFNSDPGLVAEGAKYVRIVMPVEFLQSILMAIEFGAFSGAGYTKPSFYVSLPVIFLRIPLAWLLAVYCGFNASGIWFTIASTMALNSLIFIFLFKKERWMKTKI